MPDFRSRQHAEIHPRVREVMKSLLEAGELPTLPRHESSRDAPPGASDRRPVRLTSKSLHSGRARRNLVHLDRHENPAHLCSGSEFISAGLKVTDEKVALVFEKVTARPAYRKSIAAS